MKTSLRTDFCGNITKKYIGEEVLICGWLKRKREIGKVAFYVIEDREGEVQVVAEREDIKEIISNCPIYSTLQIRGKVRERPDKDKNPEMRTGEIEILANEVKVYSRSKALPFLPDEKKNIFEETKLKFRFLDLRSRRKKYNFWLRNKLMQIMRQTLLHKGFWEVETPYLGKSTPEGARDFLVPSRLHPGTFYALLQSPQMYKQILMISQFDRYFQFARCFRDEDFRKDRQPEFTQLDIEMSFVTEDDVLSCVEDIFYNIFKDIYDINLEKPFTRITYKESIEKYGTDKPDLRVSWEFEDYKDFLQQSEIFKKLEKVKSIFIPYKFSRKNIELLEKELKKEGLPGLGWVLREGGELRGPLRKFIDMSHFPSEGTRFFIGGNDEKVYTWCGILRSLIIEQIGERFFEKEWAFLWVLDFPLFEKNEEGDIVSSHHPFTSPKNEDWEKEPLRASSRAYDLVLNGFEIGSGSIRISNPELQRRVFKFLGYSEEEIEKRFGFLIRAFDYGVPPHGGIALGFDRIVMIMAKEESIRDVIAFPKTAQGVGLLEGCPSEVDDFQLKELKIKLEVKNEKKNSG